MDTAPAHAAGSRRSHARRRVLLRAIAVTTALLACLGLSRTAAADYLVPANGVSNLNGAMLDLTCTDLVIGGTLLLNGAGINNVRNVVIQPGGVLDTTGGVILLGGNWSNAGAFVHGGGSVLFRDACSTMSASVSGNNVFGIASFASSVGKAYVIAAGSTQAVAVLLQMIGTGKPLQLRTSSPGQLAFFDVAPQATQQIQNVGVADLYASGQWLAAGQTNQAAGNAARWFGSGDGVQVIPTLGQHALALLAALLALAGARLSRGREGARYRSKETS